MGGSVENELEGWSQWLGAPITPTEDPGWFPASMLGSHNSLQLQLQGIQHSIGPSRDTCMYVDIDYTYRHIIKNENRIEEVLMRKRRQFEEAEVTEMCCWVGHY